MRVLQLSELVETQLFLQVLAELRVLERSEHLLVGTRQFLQILEHLLVGTR